MLKTLVKQDTKDGGVRFSAAVSVVKLTGGAVEDVDTVSALRGPSLTEIFSPVKTTRDALRSVAENGRTEEVCAAAKAMLKETEGRRDWMDRL